MPTELRLERAKAEAEATLKLAEAEATLKRADAETAATHKRADADTAATHKRADADAAATRMRAEADAEATRTRIDAEVALHSRRFWSKVALGGVLSGLGGALALDWYLHESRSYLKKRMAAQLRSCTLPDIARLAPDMQLLPTTQRPFLLGFLPTMVVGPTGCGKSTLLAVTAREASSKQKIAVFVRIRQPSSQATPNALPGVEEACAQLDATAAQLFAQIGFPTRRAVLRNLLDRVESVKLGESSVEFKAQCVRDRLLTALRTLFAASAELCVERVEAGMPRDVAAPVLLFDEVHDLIRDDRLARAGGRFLFDELAALLVAYGVDRRAVRAAVAGSSALLSVEFDKAVAAGARWAYYELQDPDAGTVRDALCAQGYSRADAEAMIQLCGTRMRLLEGPLTLGAKALGAEEFMQSSRAMAHRQFADLLRASAAPDARLFADTLNAVLASELDKRRAPPTLSRNFTERHAEKASKVMFMRLDGSLVFQSRLHAGIWKHSHKEFAHLLSS